jgi:hypothetical protein
LGKIRDTTGFIVTFAARTARQIQELNSSTGYRPQKDINKQHDARADPLAKIGLPNHLHNCNASFHSRALLKLIER